MDSKKEISICMGSSCYAHGNNENVDIVRNYLDEKGLDTKVAFKGQLCSNNCSKGPVIKVGDETYYEVEGAEMIYSILSKHFE